MPIVITASFAFADNSGAEAQAVLHYPGELGIDAASSRALEAASLLEGVSDARVKRVKVSAKYELSSPPQAGPDADVTRSGLLFYRNAYGTSSIAVPSISRLLAEQLGPYGGIRISRQSLQLQGLLEVVASLPGAALNRVGDSYGVFSVGAITGGEL